MKNVFIFLLVAILATSCNAQDKAKDLAQNKTPKNEEPKGNWTVNKEVDEDGNVIKYDSTYSWSSSHHFKDLNQKDIDSIILDFQSQFKMNLSNGFGKDFKTFFEEDSLFFNSFLNEEFFEKGFNNQSSQLKKMQEHIEKMRQQFMRQNQYIIPPAHKEIEEEN